MTVQRHMGLRTQPRRFRAGHRTGAGIRHSRHHTHNRPPISGPHLVHPLRCKAIASARLKNDKVDAAIPAQLLRADLLPEAWIAPTAVRQLRALLRHRASLVRLAAQLRNRIHAVVADFGYDRAGTYWTGPGRGWPAELELPPVSRQIVTDCSDPGTSPCRQCDMAHRPEHDGACHPGRG
jgi:hypothetical protein